MNIKSAIYIGLSILLASFSFLSIKYSTSSSGQMVYVYLSLAIVFIIARAYTWQKTLNLTELSIAYPFMSLVQVLILVYAAILFDEQIATHHMIGVSLMVIGLLIMVRSAK